MRLSAFFWLCPCTHARLHVLNHARTQARKRERARKYVSALRGFMVLVGLSQALLSPPGMRYSLGSYVNTPSGVRLDTFL